MDAYVRTEINKSGIATICFYHPSHNSLPSTLLSRLVEAISAAGSDPMVHLIILKSAGDRSFCAGASFDELMSIKDLEEGKKFFMGFANVINACRTCPKLIIGRVQGKAVGGGVGLAAAVDYCIGTRYASVKLSELNLGIGPFVVGPAVERKIGISAFSQMTINANQFYSPIWAMEKGLFAEICESTDALDQRIDELTGFLVSTNPEAQSKLKKVFWQGTEHWDQLLEERAAQSGQLVLSQYTKTILAKYQSDV